MAILVMTAHGRDAYAAALSAIVEPQYPFHIHCLNVWQPAT
jgi:hypothetical protein